MGFPDRIERVVNLDRPPAEVWLALTTAEGMSGNGVDATPRTYVEFTLEPHDGGTRLTLVESGFAQLPEDAYGPTYDGHTEGWGRELADFVEYLAG